MLAKFHNGGQKEVEDAARAAAAAWPAWSAAPWKDRAAVFLRAAELLAGSWRATLNAATMLGQSKNAYQAEIDSACELIDFFRFNVQFLDQIYADQPFSPPGVSNRMEYRPLEGFVFAVTPFNFTAIAGNLPSAPALAGNVVIWKPASSALFAAHFVMQLLKAAGLPDGVINMVPGPGAEIGTPAMTHPDFAGLHFTGSTATFNGMWKLMAENLPHYRGYPRIVGETGGKDFVFAHPSADVQALAVALARGAFEYQGQKCSAASRAYIPQSLWPAVRDRLCGMISEMKRGPVEDFSNFINAVIDKNAFQSIKGYIDHAKAAKADCEIVIGGGCDDRDGWFIEPTVVRAHAPDFKLMREEIFGPVLTVFVYDDRHLEETLALCDRGSPYALTGAIFSQDRAAVRPHDGCAPPRRRELLRERQADGRRREPAALRRSARFRHERQGRQQDEPPALGLGADDQGELRAADRLALPVPGVRRRVRRVVFTTVTTGRHGGERDAEGLRCNVASAAADARSQ